MITVSELDLKFVCNCVSFCYFYTCLQISPGVVVEVEEFYVKYKN